jgi:hypothetical protein
MTTSMRTQPAGYRNGLPIKLYVWRGKPPKPRPTPPRPPVTKPARVTPPFSANAAKTHCPQNHAYDDGNTYRHPSGRRHCRACQRERTQQQSRARSLQRSGVDLADPCVAVILDAASRIRWQSYTRAEIAVLAVCALRDAGLLPQAGAAA